MPTEPVAGDADSWFEAAPSRAGVEQGKIVFCGAKWGQDRSVRSARHDLRRLPDSPSGRTARSSLKKETNGPFVRIGTQAAVSAAVTIAPSTGPASSGEVCAALRGVEFMRPNAAWAAVRTSSSLRGGPVRVMTSSHTST